MEDFASAEITVNVGLVTMVMSAKEVCDRLKKRAVRQQRLVQRGFKHTVKNGRFGNFLLSKKFKQ